MEQCPGLTKVEKLISRNRLKGKSFIETEGNDRRVFCDQVIVRTAADTGCSLPNTDYFAGIICEELEGLFIDLGYEELTLYEVILALRLNMATGLKFPSGAEVELVAFAGQNFNVGFVSKVLQNYMSLRTCLDRKLQNFLDGY